MEDSQKEGPRKRCKIVWAELGDTRTRLVYGVIEDRSDGFVNINLLDGRLLRIRADCILKIEDMMEDYSP